MKLSKRDHRFLIKEAGAMNDFISGAIHSFGDRLELKTKPFESILSLVAPMFFAKTLLGRAFLALGEYYGIGLGTWIGRWLDKTLGFGDPNSTPNISEGNLQSASEGVTNELLGKTLGIKAWASNQPPQIIRNAASGGSRSKFINLFGKASNGWTLSPISLISGLIKMVLGGLITAGVVGGAAKMILGPNKQEQVREDKDIESLYTKTEFQNYSNIKNNVEETLITYLDTAMPEIPNPDGNVRSFSGTFEYLKKHSLMGSKEMINIMRQVSLENSKPISAINTFETFYGPKVVDIAKQLIPELQIGASGPKEELKQLLQGVLA